MATSPAYFRGFILIALKEGREGTSDGDYLGQYQVSGREGEDCCVLRGKFSSRSSACCNANRRRLGFYPAVSWLRRRKVLMRVKTPGWHRSRESAVALSREMQTWQPPASEGVEGRWVEPRGGRACEGRDRRDLLRVGGGSDLRDAAAALGSNTKQQRAPEERARLPQLPPAQRKQEHASVAVFPHADPKQSLSKQSERGVGAAAGCCFHVADALNRRLENEKFNFLSDSRKRRRNPALSKPAVWKDLIAVKVESEKRSTNVVEARLCLLSFAQKNRNIWPPTD